MRSLLGLLVVVAIVAPAGAAGAAESRMVAVEFWGDGMLLAWTPVAGAHVYAVYRLAPGEEPVRIGQTSATLFYVPSGEEDVRYAVVAQTPAGTVPVGEAGGRGEPCVAYKNMSGFHVNIGNCLSSIGGHHAITLS